MAQARVNDANRSSGRREYMTPEELIEHARRLSNKVQAVGSDHLAFPGAHAQCTEFLRQFAGPKSEFYKQAVAPRVVGTSAKATACGHVLEAFAEYIRSGLAGEVTPERVKLLQEADAIAMEEIRTAGLYRDIWQAFVVLLPVRSVGVMGDERTYEHVAALRAVDAVDGMTADWFKIDNDVLGKISNRIINEVRGINRVVYDISSKPPSTIEWE